MHENYGVAAGMHPFGERNRRDLRRNGIRVLEQNLADHRSRARLGGGSPGLKSARGPRVAIRFSWASGSRGNHRVRRCFDLGIIDLCRTSQRANADLNRFIEVADTGPRALTEAVKGSLGRCGLAVRGGRGVGARAQGLERGAAGRGA